MYKILAVILLLCGVIGSLTLNAFFGGLAVGCCCTSVFIPMTTIAFNHSGSNETT
jgi:uncharacterized membrane protein YoaK (UPF0700 family)